MNGAGGKQGEEEKGKFRNPTRTPRVWGTRFLRSSGARATRHGSGELFVDNAFALIEGHPEAS